MKTILAMFDAENIKQCNLSTSPISIISSNVKYSTSSTTSCMIRPLQKKSVSSNFSRKKANCYLPEVVERRPSLPNKSIDFFQKITSPVESCSSIKSANLSGFKELVREAENINLPNNSSRSRNLEYSNPSVKITLPCRLDNSKIDEPKDATFRDQRHFEEVITTDESNSHETSSIELAKPVQETIQITINQEDLESLQHRYRFRNILPDCLTNIRSKRLLQRGLSIGECERPSSTENEWYDLVDPELEVVHRGVMARTKDKYILLDVTSLSDKVLTGSLIILTMCAILALFWYQNFGPGIKIASSQGLRR